MTKPEPPPIRVDRCVCHSRTFAELRDVARDADITELSELLARADFGGGCTTCHPYVQRMLQTGEVVFHELL